MCCSVLQKHRVFWLRAFPSQIYRVNSQYQGFSYSTVVQFYFTAHLLHAWMKIFQKNTFPSFPTALCGPAIVEESMQNSCSRLKPKHQNKHQSIQHDKCWTRLINGSLLLFNLKICRAGSAFAAQQNEQLAPWKEARNKYIMACFFFQWFMYNC